MLGHDTAREKKFLCGVYTPPQGLVSFVITYALKQMKNKLQTCLAVWPPRGFVFWSISHSFFVLQCQIRFWDFGFPLVKNMADASETFLRPILKTSAILTVEALKLA